MMASLKTPKASLSLPGSAPSSPIAIPGNAAPSSPLRSLRRLSLGLSRSPASAAPSWDEAGLSVLPPDPSFKLLELDSPGDALFGSPQVASWSSAADVDLGRRIPPSTTFALEWTGSLPSTSNFEVQALAPALLQGGDYALTMAWHAENGSFQDIAAAKSITVSSGKRLIATTETNLLAFCKPEGSATISVVKERWLQSTRKERAQLYRCVLVYQPPRSLTASPSTGLELESDGYFDQTAKQPDSLSVKHGDSLTVPGSTFGRHNSPAPSPGNAAADWSSSDESSSDESDADVTAPIAIRVTEHARGARSGPS